jgi:hypothetical protein
LLGLIDILEAETVISWIDTLTGSARLIVLVVTNNCLSFLLNDVLKLDNYLNDLILNYRVSVLVNKLQTSTPQLLKVREYNTFLDKEV